jgi:hypothetical protein
MTDAGKCKGLYKAPPPSDDDFDFAEDFKENSSEDVSSEYSKNLGGKRTFHREGRT